MRAKTKKSKLQDIAHSFAVDIFDACDMIDDARKTLDEVFRKEYAGTLLTTQALDDIRGVKNILSDLKIKLSQRVMVEAKDLMPDEEKEAFNADP